MKARGRRLALAACLVALWVGAAHAGWKFQQAGGEETLVSGNRMRTSWDNGALIIDGNSKRMLFINDDDRTVASGTVDEFCESLQKALDRALEGLPEEHREMYRRMMAAAKPPKVTFEHAGRGEPVSGFATEHYVVSADGEKYEDVYLVTDGKVMKECRGVLEVMGSFSRCAAQMHSIGGDAPSAEASPEYAKLYAIGVPVLSIPDGDEPDADRIVAIVRADLDDALFRAPEGYRAVSLDALYPGGGQ